MPGSERLHASSDVTRATRIAEALGALFIHTRVPVIALTRDGRLVAANKAALRQYGYSLEELLELRIHDIVDGPLASLDGDLATASSQHDTAFGRRPHRRKDGRVLWVVPSAGPIVVDGETYIVSVLEDVTALLAAETRALEDRQKAELLWEAASGRLTDGIALIGHDFRVLRVNAALPALMRRSEADLVGRPCTEVFTLSCVGRDPCPHRQALAEQRRLVYEIRGIASGHPIRVEILPAPPTNRHFALLHVAHDLTEERAIRSQLITADRLAAIGRLAAGVAHEVNNPAAFVSVNLGVLRDRFSSGKAGTADVLAILDESMAGMDRIREIVRDLKGFARERAHERVEVAQVVASALRMATHETRGRARVERALEAGLYVDARAGRLAQVLLNLIVNAAQAIPPGHASEHCISVRTYREDDKAKIEVSDTGPGIAPDDLPHIFEPFFTTRESSGGTGLGLWLAREIVEEEGGSIRFESPRDGGARFVVELPLAGPARPIEPVAAGS